MRSVADGARLALPRGDDFAAGLWRLADPKISLASIASMALGTAMAARDGELAWGWLVLTVAGIFLIEVAKNASGEIFDFDSGADLAVAAADRSPFSGGKRVLVDGLLTRVQTSAVAAAAYAMGAAAGLVIAAAREPRVLWLGIAGIALAYFYQAPPLKLSYRGLGEAAVALAYGPLVCAGTYLVQRGCVTSSVVLVSLPLGALIAAFLWINEFPDYEADRGAGKRTLVVRLGRPRAARAFAAIVAAAFVLLALLPAWGLPRGLLLGLLGAPPAVAAAWRLLREPEVTARVVPAQAWTLSSFVLAAAGAALGLMLGGTAPISGGGP
jgi:1,4-dihydroxy-2-naphthoate octaprenyltransferase